MKGFCKKSWKKIILGTSDAWSAIRLSHRPSDPAYYIVSWRIFSNICSSISLLKIILQELKLTILYTRDHVNSSEFRLHSMFYTHTYIQYWFSIYCALFPLVLFYQKVSVCSYVSLHKIIFSKKVPRNLIELIQVAILCIF